MMEPKYPTAEEARNDLSNAIYGISWMSIERAIERAQWAAVREALVAMGASGAGWIDSWRRAMAEAERHLGEGDA